MGMIDAISGVEARLAVLLGALTPPHEVPVFRFGESDLGLQDSPPCITWVPRHGPVRGPNGLGGDGVKFPRPLHSRELLFEVHVWVAASSVDGAGAGQRGDMPACETMCQHFIAALHDTLTQGSYDVVSEDWLTGAAETNKLGVICVLGVIIRTPFVREAEPMRTITDFPETPVIVAQH
jgi:hypothetical protein